MPDVRPSSILPAGDVDYHSFKITSNGFLTVYTTGSVLDMVGELYSEDHTLIATDDNSGTDSNYKIAMAVNRGTYIVKSSCKNPDATGGYTFHVDFSRGSSDAHDTNGTFENAELVEVPGTRPQSAIYPAGDVDYHKFRLTEHTLIVIYTKGDLDTYGYLYDRFGETIATDDEKGEKYNYRITTPLSPGEYYIRTHAYSRVSTGNYELHIESYPNGISDQSNGFESAIEVPLDQPIEDVLEYNGDRDLHKFRVIDPGVLLMDTKFKTSSNNEGIISSLFDESGKEIVSGQFYRSLSDNNYKYYVSVKPGLYYLSTKADPDHPNEVGEYVINLRYENRTSLFSDPHIQTISTNQKYLYWFGYYDDSEFPLINHAVLGPVIYRYENFEHNLYSDRFGKLTISEKSIFPYQSIGEYSSSVELENLNVFSERMGVFYKVSTTSADGSLIEDNKFLGPHVPGQKSDWSDKIGPDIDDAVSFFNWTLYYAGLTQTRSALCVHYANSGYRNLLEYYLLDTEASREKTILHYHNTARALQYYPEADHEFWINSLNQLMDLANQALLDAQTAYRIALERQGG